MSKLFIQDTTLTRLADLTRALGGTTDGMTPAEMEAEIEAAIVSVDAAKAAIAEKGVTVPEDATVHELAALIAQIEGDGGLPNTFTRVEYIASSGTQYINTGYFPNQDTAIDVEMEYVSRTNDTCGLSGGAILSGNSVRNAIEFFCWNSNTHVVFGSTSQVFAVAGTPGTRIKAYLSKGDVTVDVGGSSYSYVPGSITFNSTSTLGLHCLHRNNAPALMSHSRLYKCKIWDTDVLMRDYIPCINPFGEVGLYDTVTRVFFGNAGTGTFTAGPAVTA